MASAIVAAMFAAVACGCNNEKKAAETSATLEEVEAAADSTCCADTTAVPEAPAEAEAPAQAE